MARRLADRVAVVTGGGGNIGSAICLRLAEEGSAVAVVDINGETAAATARRLAQLGANSVPVTADLRSRGAVVNALNAVMTTLGPVDVLVNSVGIDHQIDPPILRIRDPAMRFGIPESIVHSVNSELARPRPGRTVGLIGELLAGESASGICLTQRNPRRGPRDTRRQRRRDVLNCGSER
jgi:short chain dehydrogenase